MENAAQAGLRQCCVEHLPGNRARRRGNAGSRDGARGAGQVQLLDEDALLDVARRSDRSDSRGRFRPTPGSADAGPAATALVMGGRGELRFVRVDAGSGVDPVVRSAKGMEERGRRDRAPPPPMARMVPTPAGRARASISSRSGSNSACPCGRASRRVRAAATRVHVAGGESSFEIQRRCELWRARQLGRKLGRSGTSAMGALSTRGR